jgi:N4 Gp49/Sf6 Gp66 family protein
MDSLQVTDAQSRAVAVAPRVSLVDIEAAIKERYDTTGLQAVVGAEGYGKAPSLHDSPLRLLSICILVMRNGFTIIGKSAPASPENFNPELGRKFAYEDAVRQLWPLMGYALRDRLAAGG